MSNGPKYRLSEQTITDMEHSVVLYRTITERMPESIERIAKKGTVGGYVCGYHNLSQDDRCWASDDAKVFGQIKILGNVLVKGSSAISDDIETNGYGKIIGCAIIRENALTGEEFVIGDNVTAEDSVIVQDHCRIIESVTAIGGAQLCSRYIIGGNAYLYGKAELRGRCKVNGSAITNGHSRIEEFVTIGDKAIIKEHASVHGHRLINGSAKVFGYSDTSYNAGELSIINVSLSRRKENIPFLKKNFIESLDTERGGSHRK